MTATPGAKPTDNIVSDIQSKKDVDFSHITKEIEDYHRHHPRSFQNELGRINQAFQNNPTLHEAFPDLKIVGAKGQDLTMQDKNGHIVTVDSHNINRRSEVPQKPDLQDFGRVGAADMLPDGSGKYTVPKRKPGEGRLDGWDMASAILKNQSGQTDYNPSANEIANYLVEAKQLNPGKNLNRLKPGDVIQLPSTVRGGDNTIFGDARHADEGHLSALQQDNKDAKDRREAGGTVEKAYADYKKFFESTIWDTPLQGITKATIDEMMDPGGHDMPEGTRNGLKYLHDNWDKLQDLTEPVGNGATRAFTERSLRAGIQARESKVASSQAALDQAARPSIVPQSQWEAEHNLAPPLPAQPAPQIREVAPPAQPAPQIREVAPPPAPEASVVRPPAPPPPQARFREEEPATEAPPPKPGDTAPIVPHRVHTVPAKPVGEPPANVAIRETPPPDVRTTPPRPEPGRVEPGRDQQPRVPQTPSEKIEAKYKNHLDRDQNIRTFLGKAFADQRNATGGSDEMTEASVRAALQKSGLDKDQRERLQDVQENWKALKPYTVDGNGETLTPQSLDAGIERRKEGWAAKKELELQAIAKPPEQRSDAGDRPRGIPEDLWPSIKDAKVLATWDNVKGSGYQPVAGQGGPLDSRLRPIHTLEDVRAGKAPFVTLAIDKDLHVAYGQVVYIKELGVYGMAGDNGDHFNGLTGTGAVDIAARGWGLAHSKAINEQPLTLQILDARAPYEEPVQVAQRHRRSRRYARD
jgi:hypothetical protein